MTYELLKFKNDDGGFSRDHEPDLATPNFTPLAATIGLQQLADLGFSSDFTMVREAVNYLLEIYIEKTRTWRPVSKDSVDYPHAPWRHDEDNSLCETFYWISHHTLCVNCWINAPLS